MNEARRKARLKAIHAIARAAGISEENRRALQKQQTGKTSCKDMSLSELDLVLDSLRKKAPRLTALPSDNDNQTKLHKKIHTQLQSLKLPQSYAEGISHHMHKCPLKNCTPKQLSAIIAALWYHKKRHPPSNL